MYNVQPLIDLIDEFIATYNANIYTPIAAYNALKPIVDKINIESAKLLADPIYNEYVILVNTVWYAATNALTRSNTEGGEI